eukprot:TRINITY_DN11252_c0_g1_i3.p3 TRINITY_DN11252_c0_g1~~TRINITY_DN11252_c0_g1_i3.p3  ORF type:complete len:185 (-),score=5.32 TRINITY_DN11252_c0_g1_i3:617-1171(-)
MVELFQDIGEIHRVDLRQFVFQDIELDIPPETADLGGKGLDIQPGDHAGVLGVLVRVQDAGQETQPEAAEAGRLGGIDFRHIQPAVPVDEMDIVHNLDFGIFHVEHFLVEDMVEEKDRVLRGFSLVFFKILQLDRTASRFKALHPVPGNEKRRVPERAGDHQVFDFRKFSGLDDHQIGKPADLL